MPEPVTLSRKFLSDTGGWKEMKEARSIHSAGRVSGPTFDKGVLEGNVKDQGKTLKVRVVFNSRIDVENHCPCFRARRDGIICAHALAVGLEFIEPTQRSGRSERSGWGDESAAAKPAAKKLAPVSQDWPKLTEQGDDESIPATLHLVLPPKLADVWAKGRINVGVEIDLDGDRRLLKSVDSATKFFFDSSDATLYRALQQITPEDVPGMMIINVDEFSTLLAAIPGHHGVSLGKRTQLRISHLPFRPKLERGGLFKLRPIWPETAQPLIGGKNAWSLNGDDLLQPVAHGLASEFLPVLISGLSLNASNFRDAFQQLQRHFETSDIETARPAISVELKLEGSLNYLDAELAFAYGKKTIPAAKEREVVWEVEGVLQLADQLRENEVIDELELIGFERRNKEGRFVLKDKNKILQFLAHGYPVFQQRWNIDT
ncbi:SNF2 helicase associated domain-containing protein, partial [Verrucomicrobiales bacterium]|nr:SNF2 helicase associated domain-containing protein [Verrucomicrobiales bacterium]